jgi:hypothetical protein
MYWPIAPMAGTRVAPYCDICVDVTHTKGAIVDCFGIQVWVDSVNSQLDLLLDEDVNGNGYVDQAFFLGFDRDGSPQGDGELTVTRARCPAGAPEQCELVGPGTTSTVAPFEERSSGDCSLVLPGTLGPFPYPDGSNLAPNTPEAPCFVRDPTPWHIVGFGDTSVAAWWMEITLEDVEMAGQWSHDGATITGVIRGFVPMDVADRTEASAYVDLLGDDLVYNLGRDLLSDDGSAQHSLIVVVRLAPGRRRGRGGRGCGGRRAGRGWWR